MFTDQKISVKVPGTSFTLESNKSYTILGRVDESSPAEFKEQGISKIPHPLNSQNATVDFDDTLKVWDTGTFDSSPCYRTVTNKEEVKNTVKELQDKLLPELYKIEPEEHYDYKSNNSYFDEYKFPLIENLKISTNTAKNFFGLWVALVSGAVAPEEESKNPKYRMLRTPYVLVDRKEVANSAQKNKHHQSTAIYNFMNFLNSDKKEKKELLFDILAYSGLRISTKTEETILNTQFTDWIEGKANGAKNAKTFNENAEYFSTTEGQDELQAYNMLLKAKKLNLIVERRGDFYIGENSIGANLKESAKKVLQNSELLNKLEELLEN